MTVGDLIDILRMLDADMTVYVSKDGIDGSPVREIDYVRKIKKGGPAYEHVVDESFVMIH